MKTFNKSLLVAGVVALALTSCNEKKAKENNMVSDNDPVDNTKL